MRGALERGFKLALQTLELFTRHLTVRCGIDERAGRPRRIVKQRLVPARRGVVNVDRHRRRLDRAHAVVIIGGMKHAHVQDRPHAWHRLIFKADRLSAGGIFISLRPAVGSGDHLHAVGPQDMELAQLPVERHGLDIRVTGNKQKPVPAFEKVGSRVIVARTADQIEERVAFDLAVAFIEQQRYCRRGFADHAHAAIDDGVLHEAFARERRVVARRPHRLAKIAIGDERPGQGPFRRLSARRTPRLRQKARQRLRDRLHQFVPR